MRYIFVGFTAVFALIAIPTSAGAGGGGGGPCSGFADGAEITAYDSCFNAPTLFVPESEVVRVVNAGDIPHNMTASDHTFASGNLAPGATWEMDAPAPGVYRYYCTIHGSPEGYGMAAVFVVGGAEASSAPSAAQSVTPDAVIEHLDTTPIAATTRPAHTSRVPLMIGGIALIVSCLAAAIGVALRASRAVRRA